MTVHAEIFSLFIPDIAELGRQNHLFPPAFDGMADQLLICAAAIPVGGVEEVDVQIQSPVNGGDGFLVVPHDAEPRHADAAEP
jgi:hypothetical protein